MNEQAIPAEYFSNAGGRASLIIATSDYTALQTFGTEIQDPDLQAAKSNCKTLRFYRRNLSVYLDSKSKVGWGC